MLENTEGAINNEQFRETGKKGSQDKQYKNSAQYLLDTTIWKPIQIT